MTKSSTKVTSFSRLAAFSLLCSFSLFAAADNIKAFNSDTFSQIKNEYRGKEFLVGLWSTSCAPCITELKLMGEVLKANPQLPFVLIATDSIDSKELALEWLEDFGLDEIDSFMFADNFTERLRFTIDPNWYGELPRSYYFNEEHEMYSHSGVMTPALLTEWFNRPIAD